MSFSIQKTMLKNLRNCKSGWGNVTLSNFSLWTPYYSIYPENFTVDSKAYIFIIHARTERGAEHVIARVHSLTTATGGVISPAINDRWMTGAIVLMTIAHHHRVNRRNQESRLTVLIMDNYRGASVCKGYGAPDPRPPQPTPHAPVCGVTRT